MAKEGLPQPGVQWAGGASGAVVRPQGSLGLVRAESPACSWGWGLGRERPAGVVPGLGSGGVAHPSPQCSPLLWTPGPRAPPETTVLILPALGKACFLLLMGCGHQRRGAQATSEVWDLSTERTAVSPQGAEPAGRPGRKVRRSQGGRAAASHTGSHGEGLCGTRQSHPKAPSPTPGNHTLGQVGGRPLRGSPSQ